MTTKYSCTALAGTNKVGSITPDQNGYYTVVLGAFDFFNSAGEYWPYDQAKHLFEGSSSFMRRLNTGQCRGELGHPRKEGGMSYQDYVNRILQIHEDKVSHHIKSCWIDKSSVKDASGQPVMAVLGEVKPSGPYGDMLRECFKNPDENVAFSVRSMCEQKMVRGTMHKHMKSLITYDYVNEPGINIATKYNAPSLESMQDDMIITPSSIDFLVNNDVARQGMESSGICVEMIRTELGWSKTEIITLPSMGW